MIIADANVISYLVIDGTFTSLAEQVAGKDPDWRAPRLWHSEVLNVLSGYVRRGELSMEEALSALEDAHSAVGGQVPTDDAAVLQLVSISRCSSYDCEYVAAAQTLRVMLVTEDKQLLRSFPGVAISMRDFVSP
ncbi:MAG TPA: type II toxin-antitoxin system VapC family toxin [Pyrinomonadaceae bacterium]|nr:type II toxin-antitoxin system VapC family toxin [Pyrinomonadaceae bacterium]